VQRTARGFVTTFDYDSAGRLFHVTDPTPQHNQTTYSFDADGRQQASPM